MDSVSLGSIDSAETVIFDGSKGAVKNDVINSDKIEATVNVEIDRTDVNVKEIDENGSATLKDDGVRVIVNNSRSSSESSTQLSNGTNPNLTTPSPTNASKVTKSATDQTTHQSNVHQNESKPVPSVKSRNNEIIGNTHSTKDATQCHISSHKRTKCQTQETAQSTSISENSDMSSVENVTTPLVENNARYSLETHSNENLEIKSSVEAHSILDETNQDIVEKDKSGCKTSEDITDENNRQKYDKVNGKLTHIIHSPNRDLPNSYNEETTTGNSEKIAMPSIKIDHIENSRDQDGNSDKKDSLNKDSSITNENYQVNVNVNQTDNPDEDTEELEVFNIETMRHIPNGTKTISNERKIYSQKPPLWSSPDTASKSSKHSSKNQSLPCSPFLSRSKKSCRKFSIDLSEMKSLRLFFCDAAKTRGTLSDLQYFCYTFLVIFLLKDILIISFWVQLLPEKIEKVKASRSGNNYINILVYIFLSTNIFYEPELNRRLSDSKARSITSLTTRLPEMYLNFNPSKLLNWV